MRLVLCIVVVATFGACGHAAPRALTKADLNEVYASMYGPGPVSAEEVTRKLGPPAKVDGRGSTWLAKEGSDCFALWVTNGGVRPAFFSLEPARCE